MRISVGWLRYLCPVTWSDDEIARKLTLAGLEVEGVEKRALPGVVAARVLSKTPVAGSDHLNLCQVDDGAGTHAIVCGASNYAVDDVVPMARIGTVLPNGMEIKQAKLRGVESFGMLCSARELGISDDHAGLLLLPRDTPPGKPLEKLLGLPDTVFEVNVTPNRPDALSHLGVARELSALSGVPLREKPPAEAPGGPLPARVDIEDPVRCPRYIARVVEGIRIGPSPLWVQERLRACGVRSINNVVDATNLALLGQGHPLHAFDLEKLSGARIIVRRARAAEKMTTLDGKERTLSDDDLVIADADKPVALAGVMGGATSEVSGTTTRILLESALFEPSGVRRTAKRHALHTEASHRFERGMDAIGAEFAARRCAELIVQLAGGKLLPGAIDVYPTPQPEVEVTVRPARVSTVLGTEVAPLEVERWLQALSLRPLGGGRWAVPPWRRDLTREIDCIEEVARLRGYDTIPVRTHPAGVGETAAITVRERAVAAARAALSAHGFDQALNYSFVAERDLVAAHCGDNVIRVANPLTVEQGAMRTSLLPGLLRNLGHNLARGTHDLRLYELGRIYLSLPHPRHAEGPLSWPAWEPHHLGLALTGKRSPKSWIGGGDLADFFDLKGALQDLLDAMGIADARVAPAAVPSLHPANSSELLLNGKKAGVLGQVHPLVAAHFEVPPPTLLAELNWDSLLEAAAPLHQFHGIPKFPAVARDLAFVVDAAVPAEKLLEQIRAADSAKLLEHVTLFDLYRGAPVPEGKKSMAFGLSLRAPDRTLTDADADALVSSIKDRLKSSVGAEIRA